MTNITQELQALKLLLVANNEQSSSDTVHKAIKHIQDQELKILNLNNRNKVLVDELFEMEANVTDMKVVCDNVVTCIDYIYINMLNKFQRNSPEVQALLEEIKIIKEMRK